MKLRAPKIAKIIYMVLFFAGLIGFSFYKFKNTSAVPISSHELMQAELDKITPPEGDYLESKAAGYHTYRAFGRKEYRSAQSRPAIAHFYKDALRNSGWRYVHREDDAVTFCKEGHVLTLDFADVKATRYTLGYLIDGDRSSKDVIRDCR
ncbi:hypothetical protein AL065_04570 [Pseudomonas amygdali pv. ulmi]|uniref:hypothetical protein n=1 Tax=Pseudomonas amygdali TaxID=47877 RepID=UPI00070B8D2D|nr:hypothetical protein [Pseudomonas amygdali]KWS12675.1 hypothetical protein AL065_04570 [Pseudomonas amygdali pv. ulmi]